GTVRGRLCAVREYRLPSPDDLLLHCRRRTCLDVLALAHRGALESHILNCAMNDESPDLQTSSSGEASPQPEAAREGPTRTKTRSKGSAKGASCALDAR